MSHEEGPVRTDAVASVHDDFDATSAQFFGRCLADARGCAGDQGGQAL
jgi:hypothetical protein